MRKAEPQTTVPTGLQCPGGRERGRAGARSPIRAAGTVLRPGAAGGRGRWRGGRRAAAPPGRRASCRGPRGAGDPPGRCPLSGAGSPQLGTEVPLERGAPVAGCWEPSGAWLGVPAEPGVPSGAGLRQLEEGYPLGRSSSPGRAPRRPSPGVLRAHGSPGARGGPGAVSRSRGARGSWGSTGIPRCAGSWGYAGDPGAQSPRGAPHSGGRAVGQVRRRARRGRGSDLCARLPLSWAQRGGGRPRGRCPGSAMLLRGREGGREEGGRAARSRAGRGAGAAGAGGGEDPARDAGGGGPRRAGSGRRESGRAPRPGAARRGLMGMAGARSLLSGSLARSLTHARREAKPAAATSQLSKLPSATFSSPPLPAPPPPPSLPLPLACSLPGRSFRMQPPEGARAEVLLCQPRALKWTWTWRAAEDLGPWTRLSQCI